MSLAHSIRQRHAPTRQNVPSNSAGRCLLVAVRVGDVLRKCTL
jgi:hypothetical protein